MEVVVIIVLIAATLIGVVIPTIYCFRMIKGIISDNQETAREILELQNAGESYSVRLPLDVRIRMLRQVQAEQARAAKEKRIVMKAEDVEKIQKFVVGEDVDSDMGAVKIDVEDLDVSKKTLVLDLKDQSDPTQPETSLPLTGDEQPLQTYANQTVLQSPDETTLILDNPTKIHNEDTKPSTSQTNQVINDDIEAAALTACSICIEEFVKGVELRQLPGCGHKFHVDCIDSWLLKQSVCCPLCRRDVRKELGLEVNDEEDLHIDLSGIEAETILIVANAELAQRRYIPPPRPLYG
ncbi:hypothetical protein HK098_004581 [Nowakowskiella sp. JEL0407]|nr:hypothetical protein HK098_004581 [Nowakowskiella sp. JEL0407]